jgi:glycosyltransferase involved in cell wall biosynthesis
MARVGVLLSTHNGAPFLEAQLRSLLAQTHRDWALYWRDDGSSDDTRRLVTEFVAELGAGRSVTVPGEQRIGTAASFLTLLRVAYADGCAAVAFADQDDVWLPEKLSRGFAAMAGAPAEAPILYCARQLLVDADLGRLAVSFPFRRNPGFPAALTQNIATGCTIMLNRPAAAIIGRSQPPPGCLHDWWCYLLISAVGGKILADREPVVLYRQHDGNLIGAAASRTRRAIAALRRGPSAFMTTFRQNVAALEAQADLLTPSARQQLARVAQALQAGPGHRIAALRMPGLVRQTRLETALFRVWFLLG